MSESLDQTRPNSAVDKLEYAIHLAKAGRKTEAREVLRRVAAAQPLNQAAWLWLSAVTANSDEAETALGQARQINPLHPSLPQAERWLAERFSTQPPTDPHERVTVTEASPSPEQVLVTPEGLVKPLGSQDRTYRIPPVPPAPPFAPVLPKSNYLPRLFHFIALAVVALAILIGLIVLFLGLTLEVNATTAEPTAVVDHPFVTYRPELDSAWAGRNWSRVIAILEPLYQAQPHAPGLKDQLTHAYLQQGIALRHKGFIEQAVPYFNQALAVTPNQLRAKQELHLASTYLQGVEHYQAGQWAEVIASLEAVRAEDAAYLHLNDLLYSAYYNHGLAQQAAGKLSQARQALEAAIALRPDLPEPRRQTAEIEFALAPQTPLAMPITSTRIKDKLIVVGIAEQRMWVFEKGKKVFDFIVSTGEPGSDTAIGDFEILDKIDVAYASLWNLDMPYWMGIYWADSTMENGIHSLPIVKHTGYKLWDGYLGQRVSYGCVILGDEDAATLYKWAEVGTKVKIVPSLAYWSLE